MKLLRDEIAKAIQIALANAGNTYCREPLFPRFDIEDELLKTKRTLDLMGFNVSREVHTALRESGERG